ncbi:iron-hydroxamate ABC transporter substrate-binding protein [Paenibacillus athensensis]|uniref:ABC transporter substrate-binding protein n=1 Tax=Paenibacillus athensensis TaxID=1967502 RepID=A0A4Y8PTH3_9BACL|nr:iron-hydroxamate ABC transporter substrate-binding protein [Paenibacillus athensensis]MCD1261756.1 iron-hydroxamate ABC transporter substrate-binding protein [Paenibacillus athensensis]
MNKLFLPLTLLCLLLLSACGTPAASPSPEASPAASPADNAATPSATAAADASATRTYQSEQGPVEVPAHPQRVVVLSSFAGNVMALGVPLVGVDSWSKMNPRFESQLQNVQEASEENLEKIIELNPDLIIGLDGLKNLDKLKQIAPTVVYTYGKVDYLTQHLELGKLLNKEQEAKAWIDSFKQRAQKAGDQIREKIGQDATVSVVENFDKQLYVFGDHWGRGTEILYQEMKLKMPAKVKEMTDKDGYYALSTEVLPQYAGDYLIVSRNKDTDNAYEQTDTYKNMPAVKNNRVYTANAKEFYFNDPLTLDFQLDFFIKSFLGQ